PPHPLGAVRASAAAAPCPQAPGPPDPCTRCPRLRSRLHSPQGKTPAVVADAYGLEVTVGHYPRGAATRRPVEHRLFRQVGRNWARIPSRSRELMLSLTPPRSARRCTSGVVPRRMTTRSAGCCGKAARTVRVDGALPDEEDRQEVRCRSPAPRYLIGVV